MSDAGVIISDQYTRRSTVFDVVMSRLQRGRHVSPSCRCLDIVSGCPGPGRRGLKMTDACWRAGEITGRNKSSEFAPFHPRRRRLR